MVFALSLTAFDDSTSIENRPKTGNMVFLGDSITSGYGVEANQSYPALLQEKLTASKLEPALVINQGVSGDKSADGLVRLKAVLQAEPEVVVLALGGNDFLRGTSLAEVEKNLSDIITRLQSQNIHVVLVGVVAPPTKGLGYTRAVKQMYAKLAQDFEVVFLPNILKGLVLDQRYMQTDNIHPKSEGHFLIAENMWKTLKPILRQP